ncbi:hydrogenase large subunit [Anaeromyxobacter paludicola]|uniref:Hydrogenase n=1 Tax=Anaeromyxobacter paludicola TaxID=2918171 RepID=A0ABN6NEE0_9BACT|nr:hydrogenase [Anaeromyxobacter paludicola]BDG10410.1 hydrogenase [Anaeromyxobacter paludicola]
MSDRLLPVRNGAVVPLSEIPVLPPAGFQLLLGETLEAGGRLAAYVGERDAGGQVRLTALLADDAAGRLGLAATLPGDALPSLARDFPQVERFERALFEEHGVRPEGHPWMKPVRGALADGAPRWAMQGPELHEVAVGPVHAGIIEPGHFRFQCHGEHVFHLEIQLGYQRREVERLLEAARGPRALALAESIAGDTAVGHALAHVSAVEALAGIEAPPRAQALRAVGLELERLANHVGDLGAIAGDVGFLPSASYLGALRAEFLNALAELCGNRFGKGLLAPGGVRFDLDPAETARLADRLSGAFAKVREAAGLLFRSPSARNRTDGTGALTRALCDELGLVGPCARACGAGRDVRRDHPAGHYRQDRPPVASADSGDVYARALVRLLEAERSAQFVDRTLQLLPEGPARVTCPPPAPGHLAVALVEGWRGELAHVVTAGEGGRFARYAVVDPSFHDWAGLALALRGEQISDFPLCNKSFNLSYAGHDL